MIVAIRKSGIQECGSARGTGTMARINKRVKTENVHIPINTTTGGRALEAC